MEKKPLVILTGPTAVGKTGLSIGLAKALDGEIISADSMQVYRQMDIGTAKIKKEEMDGVTHHLIDIMDPDEAFNAYSFKRLASSAAESIWEKGKIPIIVGGTGFYIQTLLYDVEFSDEQEDPAVRARLTALYEEHGAQYLHDMLREVDAEYADICHANNVRKVIRALEFYMLTKTKMSQHNSEQRQRVSPYNFSYFVLNDDREKIYDRIDERIDIMLEDGLVDEVKGLLDKGYGRELTSMQGLGYKEIAAYLDGEITLSEAVYILKRDTRHFAKRQLTWFRREKEVTFVNLNEFENRNGALEFMLSELKNKGIIKEY